MMAANRDVRLWEEYRSILGRRHIHPGHDVVDTVNRLLQKSPWFGGPTDALQIPKDNLSIVAENWTLSRLWPLVHPKQVTTDEPISTQGAVLTLRWSGSHYLIDGRRRVNHWQRLGVQGPHRVLILLNTAHDV
jgi:hypothetical protein